MLNNMPPKTAMLVSLIGMVLVLLAITIISLVMNQNTTLYQNSLGILVMLLSAFVITFVINLHIQHETQLK